MGVGLTNLDMFFSYCGTLLKSIFLVLLFCSMVIIANTIEYQYIWMAKHFIYIIGFIHVSFCSLVQGRVGNVPLGNSKWNVFSENLSCGQKMRTTLLSVTFRIIVGFASLYFKTKILGRGLQK